MAWGGSEHKITTDMKHIERLMKSIGDTTVVIAVPNLPNGGDAF